MNDTDKEVVREIYIDWLNHYDDQYREFVKRRDVSNTTTTESPTFKPDMNDQHLHRLMLYTDDLFKKLRPDELPKTNFGYMAFIAACFLLYTSTHKVQYTVPYSTKRLAVYICENYYDKTFEPDEAGVITDPKFIEFHHLIQSYLLLLTEKNAELRREFESHKKRAGGAARHKKRKTARQKRDAKPRKYTPHNYTQRVKK
jgi:hypothetical protein